ncbi:unnamed protein product [Amoebophrya sp. A25]|nr:unnamed protein product [Amoebophrya sp. A25]|eukprot:GSA25T00022081001.1
MLFSKMNIPTWTCSSGNNKINMLNVLSKMKNMMSPQTRKHSTSAPAKDKMHRNKMLVVRAGGGLYYSSNIFSISTMIFTMLWIYFWFWTTMMLQPAFGVVIGATEESITSGLPQDKNGKYLYDFNTITPEQWLTGWKEYIKKYHDCFGSTSGLLAKTSLSNLVEVAQEAQQQPASPSSSSSSPSTTWTTTRTKKTSAAREGEQLPAPKDNETPTQRKILPGSTTNKNLFKKITSKITPAPEVYRLDEADSTSDDESSEVDPDTFDSCCETKGQWHKLFLRSFLRRDEKRRAKEERKRERRALVFSDAMRAVRQHDLGSRRSGAEPGGASSSCSFNSAGPFGKNCVLALQEKFRVWEKQEQEKSMVVVFDFLLLVMKLAQLKYERFAEAFFRTEAGLVCPQEERIANLVQEFHEKEVMRLRVGIFPLKAPLIFTVVTTNLHQLRDNINSTIFIQQYFV